MDTVSGRKRTFFTYFDSPNVLEPRGATQREQAAAAVGVDEVLAAPLGRVVEHEGHELRQHQQVVLEELARGELEGHARDRLPHELARVRGDPGVVAAELRREGAAGSDNVRIQCMNLNKNMQLNWQYRWQQGNVRAATDRRQRQEAEAGGRGRA